MTTESPAAPPDTERPRRIIKRYSNRKLYDTKDSRYVTLAQIAELVRSGEDVQVIDNTTKQDKTEATLALIISEEVKSRPKAVPLSTLRDLVHSQSEKLVKQLRESAVGKFIPGMGEEEGGEVVAETPVEVAPPPPPPPPPVVPPPATPSGRTRLQELVESSKQTIDQWQAAIDERVRAIIPVFVLDMHGEVRRLNQRIDELELKVKELSGQPAQGDTGSKEPKAS